MPNTHDVTITQDLIEHWLRDKRCTLWQQWDIVSNEGLEGAATWMLEQISSIVMFAQVADEHELGELPK